MKKVFALLIVTILCAVMTLPFSAHGQGLGHNPARKASDAPPTQNEASDDRYIVKFHKLGFYTSAEMRAEGAEVVHEFPELGAIAARLPEKALRAMLKNPNVALIEADPRRYPMALSDTVLPTGETLPYGIQMVQANLLTDANAANRRVCIIDSGYYRAHDDLQDGSVTASPDSGTGDPFTDRSSHGTHVAGTIAAIGGNSTGVVGVLPGSRINLHIVKVFGDDGTWAYSSDLAAAVQKCRDAGSNIISMSLGGSSSNSVEQAAFDNAYTAGVLSIAAAGNDGTTNKSYPASYSSVVSVGAVDSNKVVADFSQKNDAVELAAPGVAVLSSVPYIETNTLTVDGTTYKGNHVANASRTDGISGALVNGGRCATTGAWGGQVVLCERGDVSFFDKVRNVQTSGGVAAVIYNNAPGSFSGTLGDGNSSTIAAITISQEDGQSLINNNKMGLSSTVVSKNETPVSGYDYFDGTSMATPHVSGVAALIWSYNPSWTNAQIRKALQVTAQDLGTAGKDNSYGYGLVQAKAALDYLQTPVISQLFANPGFESGNVSWIADAGVITNSTGRTPRSGSFYAWLNGYGTTNSDFVYQTVTIPSNATAATLTFYLKIDSAETTTTTAYDTLRVQIRNTSNVTLATLGTFSNLNKGTSYVQRSFNLLAYRGQTIRVYFLGQEDVSLQTSFLIDDTALRVTQ